MTRRQPKIEYAKFDRRLLEVPLHHDYCMTCLGHAWGWVAVKDEAKS